MNPTTAPTGPTAAPWRTAPTRPGFASWAVSALGDLAYAALLAEARLTPKPGLVDGRNSGAHTDMDLSTFTASAAALRPWFAALAQAGLETPRSTAPVPDPVFLARLRDLGVAAEAAMLAATGGVNTHKGAIFSLGLVVGCAGRRLAAGAGLGVDPVCEDVAALVGATAVAELSAARRLPRTAGERLYAAHGLLGARGEAACGFARVRRHALPAYAAAAAASGSEERALLEALLVLYAVNADTNLAHRGGLAGVAHVRGAAARLLADGGALRADHPAALEALDDDLVRRGLSPGGCADLLALTWLLPRLAALPRATLGRS